MSAVIGLQQSVSAMQSACTTPHVGGSVGAGVGDIVGEGVGDTVGEMVGDAVGAGVTGTKGFRHVPCGQIRPWQH